MTVRSSPPVLAVRALVAAAVALSALSLSGLGVVAPARAGLADDVSCAVTSLDEPVRLEDALRSGLAGSLVRRSNRLSVEELAHLAGDSTTWVDPCARVLVVDEAAPPAQQARVAPVPEGGLPADVFDLSSRPGSTRTIYLDFDGATYSGTRWRNGEEIVSPAYSIDADPAFSDVERAQVHEAWLTVAEDFAPFDVNVTTRAPAPSAMTRTSASDPTYGMPVVITSTNAVGADCGCGGSAYVGVFGSPGANDRQPAWVFTDGSGTHGRDIGQVVSHEVGHTFGLHHDGSSETSYYAGAKGWAPVMGASFGRRASQWSRGEYPGATNHEDDVAIISAVAPPLADDHADTPVGATTISVGTVTAGVIGTRSDVDAFSFTAGGPTTVAVAGPVGHSDVDVRLTVVDSRGATVAVVDPVADEASDESMSAVWSVELPAPATYTALVEGVGNGDPGEAGRYSDYGSIGGYTVTLSAGLGAGPPAPPAAGPGAGGATAGATTTTGEGTRVANDQARVSLGFVTGRLPAARVGRRYRAEIRFTGEVSEARVDWRLPRGLRWRVADGRIVITGRPTRRGTRRFTAEVSGAGGSTRMTYALVVRQG